jgi:hypothetical protein
LRGGGGQKAALERIKTYLSTPSILRASRIGKAFKIYIAAQESTIGAVLLQEKKGKEYPMAYISCQLLDAKTRYAFVENLCLATYYPCTMFRHYILSSTCTIASQFDVVKYLLRSPVLSGRLGKWAYALAEYDLLYQPLWAMKGQIVADFIMDHVMADGEEMRLVEVNPWKVFFDGLVYSKGNSAGCVPHIP